MNERNENKFLYDWEDQRVPETMTRPWWDIAFVQTGLFTSGFMLMTGGLLAGSGWPWYDILAWLVIGNLIILALYILTGHIGVKERLPVSFIVEKIFGKTGAKILNFLLALTILAWSALGIHQLALAITNVTAITVYVTAWIAALLVWASSSAGYKTISILSKLAIPWFLVVLLLVEVYYGFQLNWDAWGTQAKYGGIFSTFWDGVTFVVGLNILAAFLQPNSARYARSTKDFAKASVFSVTYGMILMHFLAATLAAFALSSNESFADPYLIGVRTMGVIGAIMVWVLIWTTADNDFWHLSLSLVQLYPKIRRWVYDSIIIILSVIIIYSGLLYKYVDFASTLAVMWPAVPGIIIGHYYLLPKFNIDVDVVAKKGGHINLIAFLAWIIGVIVAYAVKTRALPFPELAGLIAAMVVYGVGMQVYKGGE